MDDFRFSRFLSDILCYIVISHSLIGMNISFGLIVDTILKMWSATAVIVGLYFTYAINSEKIDRKTKELIDAFRKKKKTGIE